MGSVSSWGGMRPLWDKLFTWVCNKDAMATVFFNLNLFVYFCKKFSILKVISGCGYAHAMGRSGDVFPKSGAED